MCRLLYVKSDRPFEVEPHLQAFAQVARNSSEYQGHGWGCACFDGEEWSVFRSVNPIWDADLTRFHPARIVFAHARSAFRNEGIAVENNMPFRQGDDLFIFNGELHGVKIKSPGRIGAEKIFNLIRRFDDGDLVGAVKKTMDILGRRTDRIRAVNMIIGNSRQTVLCSLFNEEAEYFTMSEKKENGMHRICSKPYPHEEGWSEIKNHTFGALG
ncbi:MAG: class II glutamine amidotransferase [Planctomycetota bacterium]